MFSLIYEYTFRIIIEINFLTLTAAANAADHGKLCFNRWMILKLMKLKHLSIYRYLTSSICLPQVVI